MRRKRIAPLLFLAALLSVALAAPAANAAHWTYASNEEEEPAPPLEETKEVSFEGSVVPFEMTSGVNGYKCDEVSGTMTVTPGDQGEITSISYDKCQGMGLSSGLALKSEPIGLPWSVELVETGNPWEPVQIYTDEVVETVNWYQGNTPYVYWKEVTSEWNLLMDDMTRPSGLTIDGRSWGGSFAYTGEFALDTTNGWIGGAAE